MCFFHRSIISSVWVSRSPPKPSSIWGRIRFPFWSHRTICQNFLGANQKSFSMTFPNFPHTQVVASATTEVAVLLATLYISAALGVHQDNQVPKASFFSLTDSIAAGVHQRVLGLLPRQASVSFRPQLLEAAFAIDTLNMALSNTMSLTSPGT